MEDLTKQQIILLTLLLSFVTSIGTGIITFSLLSEAPPAVVRGIDRVVERTIERVIPVETAANVKQVTVRETVVVKEEDLVVGSIEKNSKNLVSLANVSSPSAEPAIAGNGFVVSESGIVVADKSSVEPETEYSVVFQDGRSFPLARVEFEHSRLAFFKIVQDEKDQKKFSPVTLVDSGSLKLGQTVINIGGGKQKQAVAIGRITGFETATSSSLLAAALSATEDGKKETVPVVVSITTDMEESGALSGSMLLNLSGDIAGVRVRSGERYSFLPSNEISLALKALTAEPPKNKNP